MGIGLRAPGGPFRQVSVFWGILREVAEVLEAPPSRSRPARVILVVRVHIIHARLRVIRQKNRHCLASRDPADQ